MIEVGDVQIYVTDIVAAMRFWVDGLQFEVEQQEISPNSAFVRLNASAGGPAIQLIGPVDPWEAETRPEHDARPNITFTLNTSAFDETLVHALENGGKQLDKIETYNNERIVTIADPDGNAFEIIELP